MSFAFSGDWSTQPHENLHRAHLMDLSDLIAPEGVFSALQATTKKQLLIELASRASTLTSVAESQILQTLVQREKLGSTGVGNGVAIPHGRLPGLARMTGMFARLTHAVDYEAIDDQAVDLVFVLLAPEDAGADHLRSLARVSRLIRQSSNLEKLRSSSDAAAIYSILTMTAPHAAA